jgi:hypothetical protein
MPIYRLEIRNPHPQPLFSANVRNILFPLVHLHAKLVMRHAASPTSSSSLCEVTGQFLEMRRGWYGRRGIALGCN